MKQRTQDEQKTAIEEVTRFAKTHNYEAPHAITVWRTALSLFDSLQALHALSPGSRLLLEAASLLHDIGWGAGRIKHHKASRDMIIAAHELPFSRDELIMIGLIARYHRKSLPKKNHKYFVDLSADDQEKVSKLASLLRIADGLDSSHRGLVKDIACKIEPAGVEVQVNAEVESRDDYEVGLAKADLFEKVFEKKFKIVWSLRQDS